MQVKCVDNWMYEHILERNKIYDVIRETSDDYIIMIDRVGHVAVSKYKFVIVEEDKMETPILKKPLKKSETFTIVFKKPNSNKTDLKINDRVTIKNGIIDIPNSYKDKIFTIKNIFNNCGIISIGDIEVSVPLDLLIKVEKENIKINDKVVLRTDKAFQVPFPVNKGTILNVDLIENDEAKVSTDKGSFVVPLDFLIRVEKEEKKEDVRIIRCMKDLENLPNDMGLTLKIKKIGKFDFICVCREDIDFIGWTWEDFRPKAENILKCMGFKFEYKPLRTEEVLEDVKRLACDRSQDCRGLIIQNVNTGIYTYTDDYKVLGNGKYYFQEETAYDLINELNSALEREK